jgi:TIGR03009 family protein
MNMLTMRFTLGSLLASLAFVPLLGSWSLLSAQQTRPNPTGQATGQRNGPAVKPAPQGTQPKGQVLPAAGQARVPVPQNQVTRPNPPAAPDIAPEEISEELEELLRQWEIKSSQIKSLKGKHKRTVYNLVFQEEKIADGKFYLETPDKGRIDVVGNKPKEGDKSARIGKNGQPFRLVADRPERWICDGEFIIVISDDEKTYELVQLPDEAKGKNIVNSPLPFLFGMKAEEAKKRFHFKLNKNNKDTAMLIVTPRLASDRQNYIEAFVMLDKTTYLPTAVKLFDPSGSIETVYKFESVVINDRTVFRIFPEPDPFKLDFKKMGYKLVLPPAEEVEVPQRNSSNTGRQVPPINRPPLTEPVRSAASNGKTK